MDVESLKQDVVSGKVDVDRLIGLIDKLSKKLDVANQRIEELEKQLAGPTTKLDEAFSVESEEKRQEARGKKSKSKAHSHLPISMGARRVSSDASNTLISRM